MLGGGPIKFFYFSSPFYTEDIRKVLSWCFMKSLELLMNLKNFKVI